MYGRSCRCLLAISLLILAPAWVRGQSGRLDSAPDFAIPLPPEVFRPRDVVPLPALPRAPLIPPVAPPGTIGFPLLVRAAGTIFSGTVKAIARHTASQGEAVETVAITFHIENAIRGATPGEDLTIAQWIGLWSGGQRYRVGERVLLFLYPASKLGLTSCVGGAMGRFAIDPWGRVLFSAQHLSAFRSDPVLGGRSRVNFSDLALAVRRANEEE